MSTSTAMVRVLFIGNSYTSRNDLPGLLRAICAESDPPVALETEAIVAGGASLRRHWNAGIAVRSLNDAPWDYVVLQEQSTLPVKNAARYHDNVRLFVPAIRERGARIVLYLNWSRMGAPQSQDALDTTVVQIGREIGATIAPVGPAWRDMIAAHPSPPLYEKDGSHPTAAGSYLAACVFYSALSGLQPRGWGVADKLRLDRDTAEAMHNIAADVSRRRQYRPATSG
jgi:hypothetical protein